MTKAIRKISAVKVKIPSKLFVDIKSEIEKARSQTAIAVNQSLTKLYWSIGSLIQEHILKDKRGEYGNSIVATVSQQLTQEYGRGYNYSALTRMVKFYQYYSNVKIVATLSRELSWSHFIELIALESEVQREFYTKLTIAEGWSVRLLRDRINSMLYERTSLSKKPQKLIKKEINKLARKGEVSPDLIFRDPYFLDFLELKETYSEKDLEDAILAQLQQFIIELGSDFAFMARQKRIVIDGVDYKIDLLFYHRSLKCMVVIDLKLGKFRAADKGQMELYLRWLEKYEQREDENPPIGLILCSDKSDEHVELLLLKENRIKVAKYYTQLPSMKILKEKLHKSIQIARNKVETREQMFKGSSKTSK